MRGSILRRKSASQPVKVRPLRSTPTPSPGRTNQALSNYARTALSPLPCRLLTVETAYGVRLASRGLLQPDPSTGLVDSASVGGSRGFLLKVVPQMI